ncbi:MAG: squalene synthase HpnC [bacterium]
MNIIDQEYNIALTDAKEHYENFPVISLFVPKYLQKHVAVIYKFARTADDFADEETYSAYNRVELLNNYQSDFENALKGNYKNNFLMALINTINEYNLSPFLFTDLLKAFKQDLVVNRYDTFKEIENYCKLSANPVGRLILELYNIRSEEAFLYSDNICTALQLTNFYQDFLIDIKRNRLYLPINEIKEYKFTVDELLNCNYNAKFVALMQFQVDRTKKIFDIGKKLIKLLNGRLKYQILLTVLGGEKILNKIEADNYNVILNRPKLNKFDILKLITKSVIK